MKEKPKCLNQGLYDHFEEEIEMDILIHELGHVDTILNEYGEYILPEAKAVYHNIREKIVRELDDRLGSKD